MFPEDLSHSENMKQAVQILKVLLGACIIVGCAGPKVPAYKTKPQKFSWGKAYVWMSTVQVEQRNATSGKGYLLINTAYNKNVLNKNCEIKVTRVSLKDPDSGFVLIDEAPSPKDGSAVTRRINKHKTGQISLRNIPFEFDRAAFPHDLKIKMNLNCPHANTEHTFFQAD